MRFNQATFRTQMTKFYRTSLQRRITTQNWVGLQDLLGRIETDPVWSSIPEIAYFLATVGWETGWTFAPIEEKRASYATQFQTILEKSQIP